MAHGLGSLHGYGARVLLIFAIALGVWGAFQYFTNRQVGGGFRASFLIMAGVTVLQGLIGVAALIAGGSPREGLLHMVYGAFASLFLPGAFLYSRGGSDRREALVLAGAAWIVSIAYFRGAATG